MNGRPAERRQLTVMFCDLVGSTQLADALDPEDYAALIVAYRRACAGPVAAMGGTLAHYFGDGVLIYFGYPDADERAAHNAVRAAFDIVDAVRSLDTGTSERFDVAVRIGIHTGLVVAGDALAAELIEPMAIFGSAPSIAARLQAAASANSVLVSAATHRLLGGRTICRDIGLHDIRGLAVPLRVYQAIAPVDDPSPPCGPCDAASRLVGRALELDRLVAAWADARAGSGSALLLLGEPGIGKTRLITELAELVAGQPHRWFAAHGSSLARHSEFFPFARAFRRELGAGADPDQDPEAFRRLTAWLEAHGGSAEDVAAFSHLLAIAMPEPLRDRLDRHRLHDLVLRALAAWFAREARHLPLVLVVEDLHWLDGSSLELLAHVLAGIDTLPMLIVLTAREEISVVGREVRRLHLEPLAPGDATRLLTDQAGAGTIADGTRAAILRRANGNPLFIEELARAVVEQDRSDVGAPASSGEPVVPPTLRDTLMARLDRLGRHKLVAQVGSVLGAEFSYELLKATWRGTESDLQGGLSALSRAGILVAADAPDEPTYAFRHALIAETAYTSLLKRDRRRLHAQAAAALQAHLPSDVAARPELLARHLSAAGRSEHAFEAWLAAARASARHSAHAEALSHLDRAQAELTTLERREPLPRPERKAALYLTRASALIGRFGWAASEVEAAYRVALDACAHSERATALRFEALRGLDNVYLLRGDLPQAESIGAQLHLTAQAAADPALLIDSHRVLGLCRFLASDFRAAERNLATVVALDAARGGVSDVEKLGLEPIAVAQAWRAWTAWFSGDYDRVRPCLDAALRRAEGHLFSQGYVHCFAASLAQFDDCSSDAARHAAAARALAEEHGFAYWHAWADVVHGWALATLGDADSGFAMLRRGTHAYAELGAAQMRGLWLCLLADAHLRTGDSQAARASAGEALGEIARTRIDFYAPDAYRLLGEAHLARDSGSKHGVTCLIRAVRLAHRRASPLPLLKAARALSRTSSHDVRVARRLRPYLGPALTRLRACHSFGPALEQAHDLERAAL